eukprot:Rhum_TRINITY_DN8651_c0_g2::Rhum_TRINITY_DN8651_c0_g2_i1::g.29176::m.29176
MAQVSMTSYGRHRHRRRRRRCCRRLHRLRDGPVPANDALSCRAAGCRMQVALRHRGVPRRRRLRQLRRRLARRRPCGRLRPPPALRADPRPLQRSLLRRHKRRRGDGRPACLRMRRRHPVLARAGRRLPTLHRLRQQTQHRDGINGFLAPLGTSRSRRRRRFLHLWLRARPRLPQLAQRHRRRTFHAPHAARRLAAAVSLGNSLGRTNHLGHRLTQHLATAPLRRLRRRRLDDHRDSDSLRRRHRRRRRLVRRLPQRTAQPLHLLLQPPGTRLRQLRRRLAVARPRRKVVAPPQQRLALAAQRRLASLRPVELGPARRQLLARRRRARLRRRQRLLARLQPPLQHAGSLLELR